MRSLFVKGALALALALLGLPAMAQYGSARGKVVDDKGQPVVDARVVSEFQGVAGYDPKWFDDVVARIGPVLQPEDVARAITFIASQPAHVHLSEVLLRPTRQDYP